LIGLRRQRSLVAARRDSETTPKVAAQVALVAEPGPQCGGRNGVTALDQSRGFEQSML